MIVSLRIDRINWMIPYLCTITMNQETFQRLEITIVSHLNDC